MKSVASLHRSVHLIYLLQTCMFFTIITYFAAPVVIYVMRQETVDPLLRTHLKWQWRTFWYSLLWFAISSVLKLLLIGYVGYWITALWILYRIVRGWLNFCRQRLMYDLTLYP